MRVKTKILLGMSIHAQRADTAYTLRHNIMFQHHVPLECNSSVFRQGDKKSELKSERTFLRALSTRIIVWDFEGTFHQDFSTEF